MTSFLQRDGDDLIVAVRLSPRAAKDAIGGEWRDEKGQGWLQASVRAVPEKGKANAALVKLLAKRLGVAASRLAIETGDTSRLKRLRIAGAAEEAGDITARLKAG